MSPSRSYWHVTAPEIDFPRPPAAAEIESDICILGAGIVGSSAAWHLAQRGREALVVDMRHPALGATGRNAGMIVASVADNYLTDIENFGHERAKALKALAIENRERLIDLAVRLNIPIWRCGFYYLADNLQEYDALEEIAAALNRDGFPAVFHPEDPLGRGFYGALETPDDAVTHPAMLSRALLYASGQPLLPQTHITHIEPDGRFINLVGDGVAIRCKQLLVATNAYTQLLLPDFGGRIEPCRGQIQVSESVPMVVDRGLGSQFGFYYFRQVPDPARPGYGRWLMGGARNTNFAAENGHYDESPTAEIQTALSHYTQKYFPELDGITIEYQWGGTMGFTQNHLPIIERLPDLPQTVVCAGFSGHGMGLGHMAALKAVEGLIDGRECWPF